VFGQSGIAMAFYKSGALADIVIILGVLGILLRHHPSQSRVD